MGQPERDGDAQARGNDGRNDKTEFFSRHAQNLRVDAVKAQTFHGGRRKGRRVFPGWVTIES